DIQNDHSFVLIGSKKNISTSKDASPKLSREISVTEDKFKKLRKEYIADPVKDMRQKPSSGSGTTVEYTLTFDGKTYSQDEMMKTIEKERKETLKKEN